MGQAISQFDDQFLSRLAIWELAQANYHTLYNQAEAAGDIGPPEYVDEAADACKQAADIAFETEPTTTQGLIAFCKFMQDVYFKENPENLQLGFATLQRAIDAMAGQDQGRGLNATPVKLTKTAML